MSTKGPPQKREKETETNGQGKSIHPWSICPNWGWIWQTSFIWRAIRQENCESSNTPLHQKMLFSWLGKLPSVTTKLNSEIHLPSLKSLEPHSDRLQSSFYRWSLLTHLETEKFYTQKNFFLRNVLVLKVNKIFNANLNFLYVEFLKKMFNSKRSVPDHCSGPNYSKGTYLQSRNKNKKATHMAQTKVRDKRITNCSLLWTINVKTPMT